MTDDFIARLRIQAQQESAPNQIRSAIRFWEGGLKHGFVWYDGQRPLCMQWLLFPEEIASLPRLGPWSGMFPPVAERCGVVENIYSFSAGRDRKGGAALRLALAVFHEARRRGLRELRTHVPCSNLAGHRWARRSGWSPFGIIDRYGIKLPKLPMRYLYHHQVCAVQYLQPQHRLAQGRRVTAG